MDNITQPFDINPLRQEAEKLGPNTSMLIQLITVSSTIKQTEIGVPRDMQMISSETSTKLGKGIWYYACEAANCNEAKILTRMKDHEYWPIDFPPMRQAARPKFDTGSRKLLATLINLRQEALKHSSFETFGLVDFCDHLSNLTNAFLLVVFVDLLEL